MNGWMDGWCVGLLSIEMDSDARVGNRKTRHECWN